MNNIEEILKLIPEQLREHAQKGDFELCLTLIQLCSTTLKNFSESTNDNFKDIDGVFKMFGEAMEQLKGDILELKGAIDAHTKVIKDHEERIKNLEIKTNH